MVRKAEHTDLAAKFVVRTGKANCHDDEDQQRSKEQADNSMKRFGPLDYLRVLPIELAQNGPHCPESRWNRNKALGKTQSFFGSPPLRDKKRDDGSDRHHNCASLRHFFERHISPKRGAGLGNRP